MLVPHLAVALLAVASSALARDSKPSTTCSTKYGPNVMRRVPTYSSVTTKTVTKTKCSIRTLVSTVTPDRETETIQTTEIATATVTAEAGVQTATTTVVDTSTVVSTNSHIVEVTNTVVETSTSASTTTVPTPPGFTPMNQGPGYVPKARRGDDDEFEEEYESFGEEGEDDDDDVEEASAHSIERRRAGIQCKKGRSGFEFYPKQYPNRVDCTKTDWKTVHKTTTKTMTGKATTLRPETTTVTSTTTNTITDTEYPPDVTTTVTESTTAVDTQYVDVTVTTTQQTTSTVVEVLPAGTFYAACGADNIVSRANGGRPLGTVSLLSSEARTEKVDGPQNPYECCVSCQTSGKPCGYSIWWSAGSYRSCSHVVADRCDARIYSNDYYLTDDIEGWDVALSSGPCGITRYGGHIGG